MLNIEQRQPFDSDTQLIFLQMVEILFHYADRALKKCPDQGKIQVMEQHFQVRLCVRAHESAASALTRPLALCTRCSRHSTPGLMHATSGF